MTERPGGAAGASAGELPDPAGLGPAPERAGAAADGDVAAAFGSFATGVALLMIADGRDDIGTTVTAFCPVSLSPPLLLVSLIAGSYPAEVLGRADGFAVTVLAAGQRALAGRFAASGRPGARLMLDGVPHHRGAASGALIIDDGLAALECEVAQRVPAGDHLLVVASVRQVAYVRDRSPLIRFAGRYPSLA